MKKSALRALVEVVFIVFLFYANLLMGDYTHSAMARNRGLVWALHDVFTQPNFEIAIVAALIGYVLFEFLRKRL